MRKIWLRISPLLPRIAVLACLALSLVILFFWTRSFNSRESYRSTTRSIFGTYTTLRARSGEGVFGLLIDRFGFAGDAQAGDAFAQSIDTNRGFGMLGYSRSRPGPVFFGRNSSPTSLLGSLGFQSFRQNDGAEHTLYGFAVPFWALFFMAIGYPLSRYVGGVVNRQREERIALGLCPTCGTPMSPGQSRCPGCDKPLVLAQQA